MTQTLAERVRTAREQRGWTQEQLAVHAEVSRSTIQNLENGRRQPHRSSIRRIAEALGIAVEALRGGPDLNSRGTDMTDESLTAEELRHRIADLRDEIEHLTVVHEENRRFIVAHLERQIAGMEERLRELE
jgi:transcriptional regulator with XRE-family HTH domain